MTRLYLVTGGAGFIGSHIAQGLLKRGDSVRVFDNLSTGKKENLAAIPKAEFIEGDLRDLESVRKAMKNVDIVFHEAAIPSVERSLKDPVATQQANVTGTLHVLMAAQELGVKKLIFAGSSSVYGANSVFPAHEDLPMKPLSPYAASKAAAELLCKAYAHSFGLQTVILRYFNVFGPRQDPDSPYSGVIAKFTKLLLRGEVPTIDGDGLQSRDFTYVDNIVTGNLLAADRDIPAGETINLALGNEITVAQLYQALSRLLGKNIEAKKGNPRKGDVRRSFAAIDKARKYLEFKPVVDFDEGIQKTVAWYQSQSSRS